VDYLESIFNNIDEGLVILTPEGEILFFNGEVSELHKRLGWNPLVMGENLLHILPQKEVQSIQELLSKVRETKDSAQLITDRVALDGSSIYTETIYIPALEDGQLTHINILIRDVTVSRIFEKRIVGMANDLRTLIDKANAIIIATDSRGYITDWNTHDSQTTGYSKNEMLTQPMFKALIPQPDQPAFQDLISLVLNNKPVSNAEVPILSKSGKRLIFLLNATTRINATGQVIGIVFIGQDITERRKIEQEFKFAHERLLFHLENGPLGFIEWDSNFRVKSWTRRAEEIFGWSENEILGSNATALSWVYKEDLPVVEETGSQLLHGKVDRSQIVHRNVRKDGTVVWCEWFHSVQKDQAGNVVALMSLVQDVTDRKKNELRLQEAQALTHLGNWEMDLRTLGVVWSDEMFTILGFNPAQINPGLAPYLDVVHPDDRERVKSIISFTTKTFLSQNFYHRIIREKIVCNLYVTSKYEFDASGQAIRLYGTMMDVSELTEKERQLALAVTELEGYKKSLELKVAERTQDLKLALKKEKDVVEMKSRFVSIASHEFRTPLSSIQHATGYIQKNKRWASDNALMEKLKDIEKQSKHMMFLLDDVLVYGKSEAGKIQLIVKRIPLKEFLEKIMEDVRHTAKDTHRIKLILDNQKAEIETDEKLLRNVLINLLTNAIKYSPGQKLVKLDASISKLALQLVVKDTGMGIAPEDQDRIFEAFVRGRSVDGINGTGLGLSIVKKAVELLQGKIELESVVNKGTTVTVTIPTSIK
jgi:PAS domain S-box-containing protein